MIIELDLIKFPRTGFSPRRCVFQIIPVIIFLLTVSASTPSCWLCNTDRMESMLTLWGILLAHFTRCKKKSLTRWIKSCFFIQTGIEDWAHWTQKTYLGLIGGSITRRHPSKTPSGHLTQGESPPAGLEGWRWRKTRPWACSPIDGGT